MVAKEIQVGSKDGRHFAAHLCEPEQNMVGGIVLVQEMLGVTPWLRGMASRFATQGFLVLTPDLFWRFDPGFVGDHSNKDDYERAWSYLKNLDYDLAVSDIEVCIDTLKTMRQCNGRIGVIGFCMGGTIAYLAAARLPIQAAVAYYGTGIHHHLDEATNVKCPLGLHYGSRDHTLQSGDLRNIDAALGRRDNVRIWTYDTGHAFANSDLDTLYSKSDAEKAHEHTLKMLSALN